MEELNAGRELDRLIAERLGWKLVQQQDKYIPYYVVDPNGVMPAPALPVNSADQAWALALTSQNGVPHYSASVDAALALISELDTAYDVNISRKAIRGGWKVELTHFNGREFGYAVGEDNLDSLSMAFCRAWLAITQVK